MAGGSGRQRRRHGQAARRGKEKGMMRKAGRLCKGYDGEEKKSRGR